MSLRTQLLGLGLLTLALPWAGYRYVQELENALRSGLEQSLLASASTMAAALNDQELGIYDTSLSSGTEEIIYAHPLGRQPLLDGYRDDWDIPDAASVPIGTGGQFWLALYDRTIYIFLSFTDRNLIYQNAPGETPYGDRVVLRRGGTEEFYDLLFHTTAPGNLRAQRTNETELAPSGEYESRVFGFWRETPNGFTVEARLPLDLAGERLGLSVVNVNPDTGETYQVLVESLWRDNELGLLRYRPTRLSTLANQLEQPGRRLRVIDTDRWVLFDGGAVDPLTTTFDDTSLGFTERFYSLIFRRNDDLLYDLVEQPPGRLADEALRTVLAGDDVTARYTRTPEASAIVAASVPIYQDTMQIGALILEQGSDSILILTNEPLLRMISATLLATSLFVVGLISYATLLSFRIRRLARAADSALGPKGQIHTSLPGRGAKDEIGDLARSFTRLLGRLSEYTEYLSTLKGKLAHELRTPLAVVATSLDNLEREPHGSHLSPYLERLREGSGRLDAILNAMSEATVIEEAISNTELEVFDLHRVLENCTESYRDVYRTRAFSYENCAPHVHILGSSELIAQMMDKLIDNAVSFSPKDSKIEIRLSGTQQELSIAVVNCGPELPKAMRDQLFDSLVSVRDKRDDRHHLGLGLYIVSLITDFHAGKARCNNLVDGTGVIFEIVIPTAARN
ncbi:MAG: ATP-binding protein [Pseudomonadota bacterium]|nr:ATP-binding protein [Pseudomonadota bacterium]